MKISLYPPLSIHEIGQRQNQEDAIARWDNRLFVLCDGMGGHERGEVASQTVSLSLVKWFEENIKDDSFTDDQLRAALEYAYFELDKQDEGGIKKMGTTLTLLYIHAQGVTAAHIGDSRIYHIRPNSSSPTGEVRRGLLYVSRDHSLVFDLYQSGEISYEEMATHPQKNIITRAMQPGEDNRVRPDIIHITDVKPGDWFYLCSDGMLEEMTDKELAAILTSDASDEDKRRRLITATKGNQDNHTAWLVHVKEVVLEAGDEALVNEEPTARCNALNIHRDKAKETANMDISDDEDVVVVSPPTPSKKPKWKLYLLAAVCLCIVLALGAFFSKGKKEPEPSRPELMTVPISRTIKGLDVRKEEPAEKKDSLNKKEKKDSLNKKDKKDSLNTQHSTPNTQIKDHEPERHQ